MCLSLSLSYREEAFCTAVTNAKKKAESVSQTVGLCLGSVITLAEVHQSEEAHHHSTAGQGSLIEERRREGRSDLSTRIKESTAEYTSQVTAVFEALSTRNCSHKKCRKHT